MNKQELIDKYTTERDKLRPYCPNRIRSVEELKLGIYTEFIDDLEQLNEPQKPVVPKFVAEYLIYGIGNEWTLAEALNSSECIFLEDNLEKASDWLEDSMNQNIFAQAWLFGYEIEKEPIYEVVFLEDENDRYLLMELNEHYYEIVPESENDGYRKQYFTEKEIKTINERYWAFAMLVEEVAEG